MKKVGLITLNGYFNYGNRLQNYALQEFIKMNGFKCETIINKTYIDKYELVAGNKSKLQRLLDKDLSDIYKGILAKVNKNKIKTIEKERSEIFKDFSKKYINETDFYIKCGNVKPNLEKNYEFFVTGSDQIWNPYDPLVSELSFLTFAPKNKRISYAPSFGVSDIPNQEKLNYEKWLSEMEHISVREDAGANIVKQLTGRVVPVVVDPTMILTKEQWLSVSKESKNKPKGKYILTYLLGGGSKEQRFKIREISKKYKLEIVNLGDIKDLNHYMTGPSEFIDYINSASIFLTDSFHGCVFSMLLDTPFIICNRVGQDLKTSMESRIDTFLEKFELGDRRFSNIDNIDIFKCDYTKSNNILEIEKNKSRNYLKRALKIDSNLSFSNEGI